MFKTVNLPFGFKIRKSPRRITVDADLFAMDMEGAVDFRQNADIKSATISLPPISKNLVARVEELKCLLDENGRIRFPWPGIKGN